MNLNSQTQHNIKRFFQRIALKSFKFLNRQEDSREHSDYEKECFSICRELITKEESLLLMSPLSGKRYIKNDDFEIFIIIESNQIIIVNHHYSYNIDIWGRGRTHILNLFDHEVERRREEMEIEIRSNVKHSLGSIYSNLINEKKIQ